MILSLSHLFPGGWRFMADETGGGETSPETPEGDEPESLFEDDEGGNPGDKAEQLSTVMEMLAECGIKLPDDTTADDLLDNLETALIAYKHAKEHHGIDTPGAGGETTETTETTAPAIEEPMGTQMSVEFENMKARLARSEAKAAASELKIVGARLQDMVRTGKVSKATAQGWWKELHAKQLSLVSGDDRTVSRILDQMEILEKEHPNRLLQNVSGGQQAAQEPAPEWVDFSQTTPEAKDKDMPDTPEKAAALLDKVYGKK